MKDSIGFIAEEVDEIYPEVVHRNSDGTVEGIEYGKITALLTKKRVDNPAIDAFIDVFKSCDMARYSPITDGEMNEDFEKAKLVISQIDKQL